MIFKGFIKIPVEIEADNIADAMEQGKRIYPSRGGLFDVNGIRRRPMYYIVVDLFVQKLKS